MAFAAWLPKVRDHSEHCNERTWICYHQAPPWVRVVAHVGDAGQAKPHLEHNPLSLLGTCHAMALRKLNDPVHPHRREVSPLARRVMWQPVSVPLQGGLRFFPPPYPHRRWLVLRLFYLSRRSD